MPVGRFRDGPEQLLCDVDGRHDVIDVHVPHGGPGHRRALRVVRILHDGDAAELLDDGEARHAVIQVSAQHDANRARTVDLRGRSKERVDRGAEVMFFRAMAEAQEARLDDQMTIAGREVHAAGSQPLVLLGPADFQITGPLQDLLQEARRRRGRMKHHTHRRGEGGGKGPNDLAERVDAAGRSANDDDSAVVHNAVEHICAPRGMGECPDTGGIMLISPLPRDLPHLGFTAHTKGTNMSPAQPSRDITIHAERAHSRSSEDLLRELEEDLPRRHTRFDLRQAVGQAVDAVTPLIRAHGHELTTCLGADPVWVDGDERRLTEVLSSLLHNAATHTPTGGKLSVFVHVSCGVASVHVSDNGVGVRKEALEGLFAPHVMTGPHHARGDGELDLAESQRIVAQHDGKIVAHSDGPGCGSRFVVRLPAIQF